MPPPPDDPTFRDVAPEPALTGVPAPTPAGMEERPAQAPPAHRARPWARRVAVGLAALVAAGALAAAWVGRQASLGMEATRAVQERYVADAERAFESIPLLTDAEKAALRRSKNPRHVALAQALGVDPPETRAEADRLVETGALVRIETDTLYAVLPMTVSLPYLTPSAAAALDSIAVRFRQRLADAGLPPFRFSVSSGLRSAEDQAALRGGNVNAAAGRSSHEYATTYDLSYNPTRYSPAPDALPPPPRVDDRVPAFLRARARAMLVQEQVDALDQLAADYPSRLTAVLGRVLIELEDEGVLAVVRERRQPVYHVTVARRLAG